MIPEIGQFTLIFALGLALLQVLLPAYGHASKHLPSIKLTILLTRLQATMVLISFGCLVYAFIQHDFSVEYVALNSQLNLPLFYRICAAWGAHEGSMLLWVTVLGLWSWAFSFNNRYIPVSTQSLVLAILGAISFGFLLFLIITSNPFVRLLPNVPIDGQDLNPLLQDIGFVIHPPMLYMGYVGFAVSFAIAIAALIEGKFDKQWLQWMKPWVMTAWGFLTLGITLGSWWAYRELGWGGWWFWDPVENASFMPWLVGTALMHAIVVSSKRDTFKLWTILLAILAFSLSLLGTFLVRSGVLTSVHAFASDPERGLVMLVFLILVVGGSLTLYSWRAPRLQRTSTFGLCSRETTILIGNVILVVMMLTVLLGTLYPLIIDGLGLGKISVGPPYFNIIFVPMFLCLMFFMATAPYCHWRQQPLKPLLSVTFRNALISAVLATILIYGFTSTWSMWVWLGLTMSLWLGISCWRRHSNIAMSIAHTGIAICVIGVTMTSLYSQERQVRFAVGDRVQLAGYEIMLQRLVQRPGPNYQSMHGEFIIEQKGKIIGHINAEKRYYPVRQDTMTDSGIHANVWRDIYIAMGEPLAPQVWSVRVYYKPFIRWIWLGGLLMLLAAIWGTFSAMYYLVKQSRTLSYQKIISETRHEAE
ncbi:MAG: heme lyase CcmF/NrfE family subunit [Gammaproteobacteria bacterium]